VIGRTLGDRYVLVELLGRGGMAAVYRARDTRLERDVAVKVLAADLQADPLYHERFEKEAKLSARLRHPNLVEVFDVALSGEGERYLVMELLQGEGLGARAARGPIPLAEFFLLALQITAGVRVLHAAHVVHRDLSANNVMLVSSEAAGEGQRAKVLDLGIAKARDAKTLTEPGSFMGTLESMAPEQIRGEEVGAPADVYALGVLFYRMLTGAPPFRGEPATLIYQHLDVPPGPMSTPEPLPEGLVALVEWCLEKAPSARPSDAAEVHEALGALARGEPITRHPRVPAAELVVPELAPPAPRGPAAASVATRLPSRALPTCEPFGTTSGAGWRPPETVIEPDDERPSAPLELESIARKTESLVAATPLVCAACGVVLHVSTDACPSCGVGVMTQLTPFRPALVVREPVPAWLAPLGALPPAVSKRVAAYGLGAAALLAALGLGWASLFFALVAGAAGAALYVRRRVDDDR